MRSRAIRRAAPLLLALVAALLVAVPATGQDGEGAESPLERIGGDDAIQTAALLSADTYESSQYVIIARADAYADALAGSLLAGALNAPILYVMPDVLPQATIDEIQRLGAERVVILGGTHAVSQAVEDELVALGLQVGRYGGENRYETALAIAEAGLMGQAPSAVFFVEGEHADPARGWPDAINVAALAAHTGTPVIPVNAEFVPPVIAEAWAEWADATGTIIGGTTAVTQEVEDELAGSEEAPRTLTRLAGDTRFTTSQAVYAYGVSEAEMDPSVRYAIPGGSFALGLAAGAVAGAQGHPIVMVDSVAPENSPATIDLLGQARDMLDRVVLVGSVDALSQEVEDAIAEAISPPDVEAAFCLTLLHHNDGESQLLGAPAGDLYGGLARIVTLANAEQAADTPEGCESGGTVTVTSGDNFLAGPELSASDPTNHDINEPVLDGIGLSLMNYDALDIGNHDFDFGPDFLARFINSIQGDNPPPFLSANLDVSGEPALQALADADRIAPRTTVTKDGVEIGIIGLTTPLLRSISSPRDVIVEQDILPAVQTQIDELQAEGVEHIILISHLQGLGEDVDLVSQLSGVDVVVAGGGDEVLADPGDPLVPGDLGARYDTYPLELIDADGNVVPTVTTAGDYKYLGRLTLFFGPDGQLLVDTPYDDGTSRMVRVADETLPGGVEDNETVVEQVYGPVEEYIAGLAENEIATSEVALDGARPNIRQQETNLGNLVADAHRFTVLSEGPDYGVDTTVVVGMQNGGGIRNNTVIPAGPITELTTFDILPFANFIAAVEDFTVQQFKDVLEQGYAEVENAGGGFIHLSDNVLVEIDLSHTAQEIEVDGAGAVTITTPGERVRSLTIDGTQVIADGEIVDEAYTFTLASIDFSIRNGDGYPFNLEDGEFTPVGVSYQQSLAGYLVAAAADGGLDGVITAADYPEGGEGRITITGAPAGGE